ncbi:MAG: Tat pathway signal protein, partial [Eggerthellaceae bacterium]|nr:Tat pathway signal protein [Eggerthellaceae bacterium]
PAESPTGQETLVSRRRFLYGAIGVGAVAAVGAGAFAMNASRGSSSDEIPYLDAPASALTTLGDFEALESSDGAVQAVSEYDLPYGSLVWANDESIAACLLPTETGSPLAQAGLLFLGSGQVDTVLEKAVSPEGGFEIYDVRANANGMVWTEADIMQGTWRIYTAPLSDGALGTPQLAQEGDGAYDTPTITVAGKRAFWLVNAKPVEEGTAPVSRLMAASFGSANADAVYESKRRMATPPYGTSDTVTISPRIDSPSTYYQLTNVDASSGEVRDTLTLPRAIAPIEAGYGPTGFMFSFPDIYDYEGAVANLGTYTPFERPGDGNYNGAQWFDFARTPTAAPAWCGDLLIVKSTYSVCGVDLAARTYFALDVENGADSYGEYLASTGTHDTFVTYTNIDHQPIGEEKVYACRVKVWAPLTAAERREYEATQAESEAEEEA